MTAALRRRLAGLSFRRRLIVLSTAAVALAIAVAAAATYVIVRAQLRESVDSSLRSFAGDVVTERAPVSGDVEPRPERQPLAGEAPSPFIVPAPDDEPQLTVVLPSNPLGIQAGYAQIVDVDGKLTRPPGRPVELPVTAAVRAVAAGTRPAYLYDTELGGEHLRVYAHPIGAGRAMQAAQSLEAVDGALSRLALVLLGVTGAGIVGSTLLGRAVARRAAQPVQELTAGAEYVTATQDLRRRVTAPGNDELARLARSFNTMLEALAQSRQAQRQLVADASHELRTPLTTVLANVEMLGRADALPEAEREQMRHDLVSQLHELNHLVGDLVELAREEQSEEELQDFDLGELVAECVERVRAQARDVHFVAELDFAPVRGARGRVGRAIVNLLDNARKYSPPGGEVHVTVRGREVVVSDQGPGIAPADRAHVFDRFYRAAESRALPGSGLGLAIVRQVAESHGGRAWATDAPGGGAELHLELGPLDS